MNLTLLKNTVKFNQVSIYVILFLISSMFNSFFISCVGFLLNIHITYFHAPAALLIGSVITYFLVNNFRVFIYTILYSSILIFFSYLLSVCFYDISYDGQAYHQNIIYSLANNWNPVTTLDSGPHAMSLNYYQKGMEFIQSAIYSFTDRIEAGKMINFLFIICSFCFTKKVLNSYFNRQWLSITFSICICFCPVVIYQSLTYYIDLNYYSLLLCLISCTILLIKENKRIYYILFIFLSVLICSIKLSTIPTYILLLIAASLYLIIKNKRILLLPFFISICTIFAFSIIVNFNPFITNITQGKHVFHPLMGKDKIEIMSFNTPKKLLDKNRFQKFYYSTISYSATLEYNAKLPFMVHREEPNQLYAYDLRLGGFGILFSGILLLGMVSVIYRIFHKHKNTDAFSLYYILFWIIVSIIINPEFWWARYTPQTWLIPVIALLLIWKINTKFITVIKYFTLFFIYLNIFYFFKATFKKNIHSTNEINTFLRKIKQSNSFLLVDDNMFDSAPRLKENNIKFIKEKLSDNYRYFPQTFHLSKFKISNK